MDTMTDNPVEATQESGAKVEASAEPSTQPSYTVKVGGIEREVTLDELQSGYMRQADYTQKTQALAEDKRRLAQAEQLIQFLDRNPERTLQALAEQYGVSFSQQQQQPSDDAWGDDWTGGNDSEPPRQTQDSVLLAKVQELEARLADRDMRDEQAAISAEIKDLQSTYGDDIDVQHIMRHAVDNGFGSLAAAYRDLYFDDVFEEWRKHSQKKSEDDAVTEQKRAASVVSTGGAANTSAIGETVERPKSIRDAYLLAKRGIKLDS